MSHYSLQIPVDKEDLQIIRREFDNYIDQSGGLRITVLPENSGVLPSDELMNVIKTLFVRLMCAMIAGEYEGLN